MSLGFFILPVQLFAIGLLVKPQKLTLSSIPALPKTAEILVQNNSDQPALYLISVDAYKNQIKIEPSEIKLEPNESKTILITAKFLRPGSRQTNISITANYLSAGELSAVAGVKVNLQFKISNWFYLLFGFVVIFCFVLFFGVKYLLALNRNKIKL